MQLDAWLGQGSIKLVNIFDHAPGDGKSAHDFHAAVDGKGPTITLIKVLDGTGYFRDLEAVDDILYDIGEQLIGGYNPQSWDSVSEHKITIADEDRTAFLFNLTGGVKQGQKLSSHPFGPSGQFQSLNWIDVGPAFGADDLMVYGDLSSGHAQSSSYGEGYFNSTNPDDILNESVNNGHFANGFAIELSYGDIEVFAIVPLNTVPEAASIAVWSLLTMAATLARCRSGP